MENNYISADGGGVKISDEVIATIASVAAKEVDGVSDLVSKMPVELNKKGIKINARYTAKGVFVAIVNDMVELELDLAVKYVFKLPEVASDVQDSVCKAVETMTSMKVSKVTVNIVSVTALPNEVV